MSENKKEAVQDEMLAERFALSCERIAQILQEEAVDAAFRDYFVRTAGLIDLFVQEFHYVADGNLEKAGMEELREHNRRLYEDILPENYGKSYANPSFAAARLGKEFGQMLSFLAAELRSLIAFAYEQDVESMVIRMELFLEVYHAFVSAAEEGVSPRAEEIRDMIYWFASDYSETMLEKNMRSTFDWKEDFALRIIMDSDLQDIGKKKSVNIRYFLGFERVVRKAVENFAGIGLESVIYRAPASFLEGRKLSKNGYYGACANKQFEYDHEYDQALYYDKKYVHHRLDNYRNALESVKELAAVHGGPAVIEEFGGIPFEPESKEENLRLNEEQQKLAVEFQSAAGALMNEYVKGEERSFTIIAFPVPEIGDNFEEIFDGVLRINTLDYTLYQGIQQKIIDTLDKAAYVRIKGCGANRTDLKVVLHRLKNPEQETNFENCVADVNIPVGEVFTSPVLAGTQGKLHVSKVYLNGLKYLNLEIDFKDGMIADYSCTNFDTPEENRKFIRENVLHHHDTLPMGEFAIGTNTTAYAIPAIPMRRSLQPSIRTESA